MKTVKKTLIALSFLIAGAQLSSCQTGTAEKGGKISVDEFSKKINSEKDPQIIDVRTPEEVAGGYIKGAENIDWNGDNFVGRINKFKKEKAVYVYCLSGGRSSAAAAKMKSLGFQEVYDLKGGMMAWNNADMPVVKTSDTPEKTGMSLSEYDQKINSEKLVLVDFNAPWCAPCKKMAPMLEELEAENKNKLVMVKINVDENKELAKALKITDLPVLILYKNGKSVYQKTGFTEKKELVNVLEKN
ncbi:MAG: thioredoxin [Bacteroidia bacterium]